MTATSSRGWSAGVWVATALLAALFLYAGTPKLAGSPMPAEQFAHLGYPHWFLFLIGAWEVLGAILLVIPRASFYAASLLAIEMIGAVYTPAIRANQPKMAILPFVVLLFLALLTYVRRPAVAGRS